MNKETITEKEIRTKTYEITKKSYELLTREILRSIRRDLWKLYYLKLITRKERAKLEYEIDKVIYKDSLKKLKKVKLK